MAIQYATGSRIHQTFSGVYKNDLLTAIPGYLVTAGWTQLSGITPSAVSFTSGTPGIVNLASHGLAAGTQVVFTTTGSLIGGISVSTPYYVINPTTNTFNLASTIGGSGITFSGSSSGTCTMNSEIVMQCAVTPQGYQLNCRMRDNGGTCVTFTIETTDGAFKGTNNTTYGGQLLPATAKTWHIVANAYQFWLWVDGDYLVGNEFLLVSCPWMPSFLTPAYIGVMQSAGRGDGTGCNGCGGNWRYSLYGNTNDNAQNWYNAIYGKQLMDSPSSPGGGNTPGEMAFPFQIFPPINGTYNPGGTVNRYANLDLISIDTNLAWGSPNLTNEPMMRCQLWDSIIILDQFQGDQTATFDSHNWICLTSSISSVTQAAVWIVTP